MRDLGTLDGYAAGRVLRMNAGGDAVGWSETGAGVDDNRRAVLYTSGNLVDLGVPTGHESSQAYGLNNGGIVVGTATDAFGRPHAFAWRDGRIVNLNALLDPQSDWVLQTAFDVTDSGQVVGSGTLAGLRRAYRLQLPASLGGAAAASDASSVSTTPLPSAAGSADATPTQPTDADRGSTGPKALPSTGGGADGGPFGDAALLLAALVLGALGALGAAAEGRRGTPFQSEAR
jgi:probable HAF family extracellular repeat protein